jgi:hypothetical protein
MVLIRKNYTFQFSFWDEELDHFIIIAISWYQDNLPGIFSYIQFLHHFEYNIDINISLFFAEHERWVLSKYEDESSPLYMTIEISLIIRETPEKIICLIYMKPILEKYPKPGKIEIPSLRCDAEMEILPVDVGNIFWLLHRSLYYKKIRKKSKKKPRTSRGKGREPQKITATSNLLAPAWVATAK